MQTGPLTAGQQKNAGKMCLGLYLKAVLWCLVGYVNDRSVSFPVQSVCVYRACWDVDCWYVTIVRQVFQDKMVTG